jgi:hypothetical protein
VTASPGRTTGRLPAAPLLAATALLLIPLTACGSGSGGLGTDAGRGSDTSCDLTGCSVTFVRDGTPEVSVLGVPAKLIGVDGDVATIEVAGQRVTLPVGGQAQSDGFTVRLERATDTEVVVRVTHGLGGGGGG